VDAASVARKCRLIRSTETFTTVDTSGTTPVSVPGEAVDDVAYTFNTTGATPQITGVTDADNLDQPPIDSPGDTATSDTLDPAPPSTPAAVATDPSTGAFVSASDTWNAPAHLHQANLLGVDQWALDNAFGGNNGFKIDCTDFASRALNKGGHLRQITAPNPATGKGDLRYWYQWRAPFDLFTETSYSWSDAKDLATWFVYQGAHYLRSVFDAHEGDIIFANWKGGPFKGITHTGVITLVTSHNVYITQHTIDRMNEPLNKQKGFDYSWKGKDPEVAVWVVVPAES
jgi:hypothetical protein